MMREIGVGIRIDLDEGLSFMGIEEVNGLINRGAVVKSIEAGGAIVKQIGEDDENVSLTLTGCDLKVIVDDTGIDSSPGSLEHDRLYKEGSDLIKPYMHLDNRTSRAANTDQAHEELRRGIDLLSGALAIDPANWAAHWVIGKAHQVLGEDEDACDAFGKSYGLQKGNHDVAREYMFECLKLGRAKKGIAAAKHAVGLQPENAGLVSNLALALLIGAELDEAMQTIDKALSMAPEDQISQNLKEMIEDVRAGRKPQPEKMSDLK